MQVILQSMQHFSLCLNTTPSQLYFGGLKPQAIVEGNVIQDAFQQYITGC